jgi:hypothetical protein
VSDDEPYAETEDIWCEGWSAFEAGAAFETCPYDHRRRRGGPCPACAEDRAMSPPCSREQYISAIVDYILKETPEQQAELLALGSEKDRPGGRRVFDADCAADGGGGSLA